MEVAVVPALLNQRKPALNPGAMLVKMLRRDGNQLLPVPTVNDVRPDSDRIQKGDNAHIAFIIHRTLQPLDVFSAADNFCTLFRVSHVQNMPCTRSFIWTKSFLLINNTTNSIDFIKTGISSIAPG